MPDFFIVLFKINVVLALFAIAYYLVLRRLTFYVVNRFFLTFGILFATCYPFIDLTEFWASKKHQAVAFIPQINDKANAFVQSDFFNGYWFWIAIVFYLGVTVMLVRLVIQFISLYKIHRKSKPGLFASYKVRLLNENVSPFSFWQNVYLNPSLHKDTELDAILAHEYIHVKQWHSLDIILAELSVVFYWFNPGVWLMKKAVKENLEFITDERILKNGMDKKAYQYSLIDVGNLTPATAIVNNFNLSDLKKRIQMMNAKRSSKLTLGRYVLIVPLILVVTLAFTVSKENLYKQLVPIAYAAKPIDVVPVVDGVSSKEKAINKKQRSKAVALKKDKAKVTDTNKLSKVIVHGVMHKTDSVFKGAADVVQFVRNVKQFKSNIGSTVDSLTLTALAKANAIGKIVVNADKKGKVIFRNVSTSFVNDTVKRDGQQFKLIVDGKTIDLKDIDRLTPSDIERIEIVKKRLPAEIVVVARRKD